MNTKITTIMAVLFTITFQAQAYVLTFDDISDFSEDSLNPVRHANCSFPIQGNFHVLTFIV